MQLTLLARHPSPEMASIGMTTLSQADRGFADRARHDEAFLVQPQ